MNGDKEHIKPLSYMQAHALDLWFRGGRKSKAKALREAGYSSAVVRQPHKVFNSPAVEKELELRGYGTRGISNEEIPKQVIRAKEVIPIAIDFSKLPQDQIIRLKEQLAKLPDTNNHVQREIEESSSYTPTSSGADIFDSSPSQKYRNGISDENYSCM